MKNCQNTCLTIKLDGFKSYPEKTIIGPFSGLLGIIGKNGSGKTNIINIDKSGANTAALNDINQEFDILEKIKIR